MCAALVSGHVCGASSQLWGDRLPNGSWDGIVDVLYTGKADIGVGNMYVSDLHDRMDFQHYSAPYAVERSCFTAKMEPPVPRWRSLILPYQTETWLAFLGALAVCGCVLYLLFLLTRFSGGSEEHRSLLTAASSFLYAAGMHFRQPQHRVPARDSTRSFFLLLWFYAIVLTTSYSSNLTAFLTKSRQPKGMETIRELREANLPILCVNSFFKGSMVLSENKDIQALADRYRVVPGFEQVYKLVLAGEGVNIESRSYLEYVVSTQFMSPQGHPRMRIMKECISVSHIAMGFQIYSPLKAKFSKVIMWMVEGGLVTNWFFEAIERAKKIQEAENSRMKGNGSPVEEEIETGSSDAIALSIDHMQRNGTKTHTNATKPTLLAARERGARPRVASALPAIAEGEWRRGGALHTKDDSKDEAAAAADTDADPARLPSGSGGRHRVSFPERYAAVVKQVHEDLDATFQEQYDNLCQLQQEEDAVMERMEKLKAEAHAANDGIEQQGGVPWHLWLHRQVWGAGILQESAEHSESLPTASLESTV
ncbi:Variant Ionotropic Glutamate Receptor [Penaeus vannamei]|uniref:Variant Ionotropic Glutamate Receptor n=1 Tax=Penaeus vannamei TaxID=6689 RepID=A0A3R7LTZ2_PENVA|nr:Variant Ionotropic Glutamate Receptor [Penaeus vannamei]